MGIILGIYYIKKYILKECLLILTCILFFFCILLIPKPFNNKINGEVKNVFYNGIQIDRYFLKTNPENYQIGDVVEADIILNEYPKPSQDGSFDEYTYLMGNGIDYVCYPTSIEVINHRFHFRNSAISFVKKHADERLKDLYLYLLLGYKSDGITEITQMAKDIAVLHVFSISGMHFTLLSEMIKKVLSYIMSEKSAEKIGLIFMTFYSICLEGNMPALRAYFVYLFRFLGFKDSISRFGLSGIVLLMLNPRAIFQTGFIYSMTLYFLVILTSHLKKGSVFVYLGSMVIGLYFQYEIIPLGYLFSILFNTIITILFPIFVVDLVFPHILSTFCFLLYEGMQVIMKIACHYSFTIIIGKPPEFLCIAFYISYVFALYHLDIYKTKSKLVLPIFIFMVMSVLPYLIPYGEVMMVNVGQGDCFVIKLPHIKETIMIDTGGLAYKDVAKENIIPLLKYKGIKKIDTVYISHQDFDHCGALESLKLNFKVKEVVEDFKERKHGNLIFKQINPKIYDNENDNSLVIYAQIGGQEFLFTGDISTQVEKDLIELYPNLDIDVLKVGHHGSRTSSSHSFLEVITPKLSLISVGKNNLYGHPNREVISRLKAYGSLILRTDEDGYQVIYFTNQQSYIENKP